MTYINKDSASVVCQLEIHTLQLTMMRHCLLVHCQTRQICQEDAMDCRKCGGSYTHTAVLRPFSRDHPGEPVLEDNFWTLWCKERLTEADTPTIRLDATPAGLTSAHLHHLYFLQAGCPFCRPTNSVKALKAMWRKLIKDVV